MNKVSRFARQSVREAITLAEVTKDGKVTPYEYARLAFGGLDLTAYSLIPYVGKEKDSEIKPFAELSEEEILEITYGVAVDKDFVALHYTIALLWFESVNKYGGVEPEIDVIEDILDVTPEPEFPEIAPVISETPETPEESPQSITVVVAPTPEGLPVVDFSRIKGIGKKINAMLHKNNVITFSQFIDLTESQFAQMLEGESQSTRNVGIGSFEKFKDEARALLNE